MHTAGTHTAGTHTADSHTAGVHTAGTHTADMHIVGAHAYTQYPIIRNSAEFLGKFKKQALGRSNLRNTSKSLRNGLIRNSA